MAQNLGLSLIYSDVFYDIYAFPDSMPEGVKRFEDRKEALNHVRKHGGKAHIFQPNQAMQEYFHTHLFFRIDVVKALVSMGLPADYIQRKNIEPAEREDMDWNFRVPEKDRIEIIEHHLVYFSIASEVDLAKADLAEEELAEEELAEEELAKAD